MPVEFRRDSKRWYGRYQINGKRKCVPLEAVVRGVLPCPEYPRGDDAFVASKGAAQVALKKLVAQVREKRNAEEYVQQLHEIRTGRRIGSIPLPQLAAAWDVAPRKRKGSPRYVKQAHSLFERFVAFIEKGYPETETLADVTPDMAETFMQAERERGVSGRTSNAALILLRSAFKALANRANIVRNPFDGIPTVSEDTTHRKPFNQAELEAILAAAQDDDFIRPIIITGMCTAMRRGDCCTLRWGDVDLTEGFVRVKTSKTGETVEIPLLPVLQAELQRQRSRLGKKEPAANAFVFPDQVKMYRKNPDGITWRVRKIFEQAGFFDPEEEDEHEKDAKKKREPELKDVPRGELITTVRKMLAELTDDECMPEKRENMAAAFEGYMRGEGVRGTASGMGMSPSSISLYLHEIEDGTGLRVVPKRKEKRKRHRKPRAIVSTKPEGGARRVSVRDFHSFRVTWITLALSAGVPLELVQRVTGHKTTQVVLKHYFKPGRDAFKKAIESAMPTLIAGSAGPKTIDVVAEETGPYGEAPGPGELLEKVLVELSAVKSKSKRLANAIEMVTQAKQWVDQSSRFAATP